MCDKSLTWQVTNNNIKKLENAVYSFNLLNKVNFPYFYLFFNLTQLNHVTVPLSKNVKLSGFINQTSK